MKTKSPKYKAVVVGCGKIGALLEADPVRPKPATHAGAYSADPRVEIVGLVDAHLGNLKEAGALFPGATLYENLGACLAETKPDIVSLATPANTHRTHLDLLIKNNVRAVVCEKPIAYTLDDAQNIEDMVKESGIVFVLNHQRRFFPLFQKAREDIARSRIGTIRQITGYYNNGLFNNGTHLIDALRFLLDDEMESATGFVNEKNTAHPPGDSNIDGLIHFKRGAIAMLQSFGAEYALHEIRIFGDTGALVVADYGYTFSWFALRPSAFFVGYNELALAGIATEKVSMVSGAITYALDCLDGTAKPGLSTAVDGVAALNILDALRRESQSLSKLF